MDYVLDIIVSRCGEVLQMPFQYPVSLHIPGNPHCLSHLPAWPYADWVSPLMANTCSVLVGTWTARRHTRTPVVSGPQTTLQLALSSTYVFSFGWRKGSENLRTQEANHPGIVHHTSHHVGTRAMERDPVMHTQVPMETVSCTHKALWMQPKIADQNMHRASQTTVKGFEQEWKTHKLKACLYIRINILVHNMPSQKRNPL